MKVLKAREKHLNLTETLNVDYNLLANYNENLLELYRNFSQRIFIIELMTEKWMKFTVLETTVRKRGFASSLSYSFYNVAIKLHPNVKLCIILQALPLKG